MTKNQHISQSQSRRFWICLLIPLLLLIICPASGAEAQELSGEEELMVLLSAAGDQTEFSCGESLYRQLRDSNFYGLYRLLVRAGFDYNRVRISYIDSTRFISLSGLVRTGLPWAECGSAEEVRDVFRILSDNAYGIMLLCPKELTASLIEGSGMDRYAAEFGIKSFSCTYSTALGIIRITDPIPFEQPYAAAGTNEAFASAISLFADRGIHDFYLVLTPELYAVFTGESSQKTLLIGGSRLTNYYSMANSGNCTVHFTNTEFTDMPREICESAEDIPGIIRRMGAAGVHSFELLFPDTAVFETLAENNFALLLKMEAQAGMSSGSLSYSSSSDRIVITDAVIDTDMVLLETPAQAAVYLEAHIAAGEREVHLFCTPDLYYALLGDISDGLPLQNAMTWINDLTTHAGISEYSLTCSGAAHVITVNAVRLFPGTEILLAVRNGTRETLSPREQEALAVAENVAAASLDPDPLQTARNIHDWICENTVYGSDETSDEDDNAIGPILNGEANCDGYTDAFYLIGSLAGLHVRYQHGDSYEKDLTAVLTSQTHIWNLLEINGIWHMVDVTWDDEDTGRSYLWFNVGRDIADRLHFWNEETTVSIAPITERVPFADNEFYIRSREELYSALNRAQEMKLGKFHLLFENADLAPLWEEALAEVSKHNAGSSVTYSWNEKMSLLTFIQISW